MDEFDVCGFAVMSEAGYKENLDFINKEELYPIEVYFGSNEYNTYTCPAQITRSFEVVEITEEEVKTIKKLFCADRFGTCLLIQARYQLEDKFYDVKED